jgi:Lrp/AsnC family transcriptional regulator for asnA, asnC and gidA
MQLDKTDWSIIELLSEQYLSNNEIARRLEVSEGTVRRRIKTLQDEGIMRIKAQLDPNVMEERQIAMVTANVTEANLLDKKARELSRLKGVTSVSILSGQFDLLIEVIVDSNRGLMRFLIDELSTVEGLSKTETFVILKSYGKYI